MNTSVYHNQLLNIYHKTYSGSDGSNMMKVYNMINVAMVVKGIRPGAILASISETNKASVVASLEALGCVVKDIRQTKSGHPVLLFVRDDNQPKRNLLASMITALNKPDEPINSNSKIIQQSSPTSIPHETIGTLIGYFNSLSDRNLMSETKSVKIKTTVLVNGTPVDIHLFPQKVKVLDTTRKQTLNHMAEQIRSLDLPDGFEIKTVTPFFTSNGVNRPLQPNAPPRLTGGKRNHTRKQRGRRQTRSRSRSSRR